MAYAYATTNLLQGLAATAFTWSAGLNDTTRSRLNDARMDARYVNGNAASGLNVIVDLGAATTLSGMAVLNTNCAVLANAPTTVQVDAANSADFLTSPVLVKAASTLNTAAPKNKDFVLQFSPTYRRFWKLTFTFSGTINSFAIGELWAFSAQTQLSRKAIYGGGESEEIRNAQVDFYSGNSRGYFLGGPIRELQLPFADLTAAQRDELLTLWRTTKNGATPFLWIPSFEQTAAAAAVAEQEVIYGRCQVPVFKWSENDFQLYTAPEMIIRSLGREVGS